MRLAWESQGDGRAGAADARARLHARGLGAAARAARASGTACSRSTTAASARARSRPGRTRSRSSRGTRRRCSTRPASERAHVVGASLGGFAAQALAADRPERVDRLVLVGTSPGGADAYPLPEGTLRLMAEAPSLRARGRAAPLRRERGRARLARRSSSTRSTPTGRRIRPTRPGWAAQAARRARAGTRATGSARIAAPTLVVAGHRRRGRRPSQRAAPRRPHPGRAARAARRRRAPLVLGAERGVRRPGRKVPRMTPLTVDRMLRDRARTTPGRVAIEAGGGDLDVRRARPPLGRARRRRSSRAAASRRSPATRPSTSPSSSPARRRARSCTRSRGGSRRPRSRGSSTTPSRPSSSSRTSTASSPRRRSRSRTCAPPLELPARRRGAAAAGAGRPAAAHLHVGHDRQAEGRAAHPRELLLDEPLVRPRDRHRAARRRAPGAAAVPLRRLERAAAARVVEGRAGRDRARVRRGAGARADRDAAA